MLASSPGRGGVSGYSVCSPANSWRSPDDTPRNSAIANQTSSPGQSHHTLRPVFLHILGRTRGWGVLGLHADPWDLGAISSDARCVATAVAMENHHHSNKFKSLQKRKSHSSHSIHYSTKSKTLGVTTTFWSTLQFLPSARITSSPSGCTAYL